jgi:hypothetical protein
MLSLPLIEIHDFQYITVKPQPQQQQQQQQQNHHSNTV